MLLVTVADEDEANQGQEDEEQVAHLVALVPWVDLTWVSFVAKIVNPAVKPVTIAIDMEFVEISELVEWVMLEVVHHDLVLLGRLRFILKPVLGDKARGLEGEVLTGVHAGVNGLLVLAC